MLLKEKIVVYCILFLIVIGIPLLSCTKATQKQFPPEEKRYLIKVLVTTDASITYKCNQLFTFEGNAYDCEDNEGREFHYLNFRANVTEITDKQKELQ